jgi:hypothetical protein
MSRVSAMFGAFRGGGFGKLDDDDDDVRDHHNDDRGEQPAVSSSNGIFGNISVANDDENDIVDHNEDRTTSYERTFQANSSHIPDDSTRTTPGTQLKRDDGFGVFNSKNSNNAFQKQQHDQDDEFDLFAAQSGSDTNGFRKNSHERADNFQSNFTSPARDFEDEEDLFAGDDSDSSFDFGNPKYSQQLSKTSADLDDSGFNSSSSSYSDEPSASSANLDKADVFGSSVGDLDIWGESPDKPQRKSTSEKSRHSKNSERSNSKSSSRHERQLSSGGSNHSHRSSRGESRPAGREAARRKSSSRSQSRSQSPGALKDRISSSRRKSKGMSSDSSTGTSTSRKSGVMMAPLILTETMLDTLPASAKRPSLSNNSSTRSSRRSVTYDNDDEEGNNTERLGHLVDSLKKSSSKSSRHSHSSGFLSPNLQSSKHGKETLSSIRRASATPSGTRSYLSDRNRKVLNSKERRSNVQDSLKLFLNDSVSIEVPVTRSDTGSVHSVPVDNGESSSKKERQRPSRRISMEAAHRGQVQKTSSGDVPALAKHLQSSRKHRSSGTNRSVSSAPAKSATSSRRKKDLSDKCSKLQLEF